MFVDWFFNASTMSILIGIHGLGGGRCRKSRKNDKQYHSKVPGHWLGLRFKRMLTNSSALETVHNELTE
jgi:hypothetical protein